MVPKSQFLRSLTYPSDHFSYSTSNVSSHTIKSFLFHRESMAENVKDNLEQNKNHSQFPSISFSPLSWKIACGFCGGSAQCWAGALGRHQAVRAESLNQDLSELLAPRAHCSSPGALCRVTPLSWPNSSSSNYNPLSQTPLLSSPCSTSNCI